MTAFSFSPLFSPLIMCYMCVTHMNISPLCLDGLECSLLNCLSDFLNNLIHLLKLESLLGYSNVSS